MGDLNNGLGKHLNCPNRYQNGISSAAKLSPIGIVIIGDHSKQGNIWIKGTSLTLSSTKQGTIISPFVNGNVLVAQVFQQVNPLISDFTRSCLYRSCRTLLREISWLTFTNWWSRSKSTSPASRSSFAKIKPRFFRNFTFPVLRIFVFKLLCHRMLCYCFKWLTLPK